MPSTPSVVEAPDRRERSRARKARLFLDAAQRIVAAEGFEGLTMSRLAAELDTVVSAVYRYYPSKGALIAAIQVEAVERLHASLSAVTERFDAAVSSAGLRPTASSLARLVLFGRWLCATRDTYPEELRLLQMIMAQRVSALDEGGGDRVFPEAFALLARGATAIEEAQQLGSLSAGNSLDRTAIWASGLAGVIELADLEGFAPALFGGTRLAQQANLDLIAGWGAKPAKLAAASTWIDEFALGGPLAP